MKIGERVIYLARQGPEMIEVRGEIVGFEEAEWTKSGTEAAVRFTDTVSGETWIQHIDPIRLEVVNE